MSSYRFMSINSRMRYKVHEVGSLKHKLCLFNANHKTRKWHLLNHFSEFDDVRMTGQLPHRLHFPDFVALIDAETTQTFNEDLTSVSTNPLAI